MTISDRSAFIRQLQEQMEAKKAKELASSDPLAFQISHTRNFGDVRDILESLYNKIKALENENATLQEKLNSMEFYD